MGADEHRIVLDVRGASKYYGHVAALSGVDFTVRAGEVHALLGDNGAGKSTLVKILSGAIQADEGEIWIDGRQIHVRGPRDVQEAGVETVFQDLALAPTLDAGSNVFLGREILRPGLLGRLGFVDRKAMRVEADAYLKDLGVRLPAPEALVEDMSGGQKQAVAVARAAVWGRELLLMDEPTAALGVKQTAFVLDLIRRLRDEQGKAVVLISHNLPDVFAVSDRVTVLRLGRKVLEKPIADTSIEELTLAMAGLEVGT